MTPESPKLEACPFCGNPPELYDEGSGIVGCADFNCPAYDIATTPTIWNARRPAPTASPAPVDHIPDAGKMVSPALPEGVAGDVATVMAADGRENFHEEKIRKALQAARRLAAHVQSQSSTIEGLREEVERLKRETPESRCKNFNETSGAIYGGNVHPDRCVCQGTDPTPHRHYREWPFSCSRCGHKNCAAYRAALKPVARGE